MSERRLLIFGPPLAGKRSMLLGLAAAFGQPVAPFEARSVANELVAGFGLRLALDANVTFETVFGVVWATTVWSPLLERASDIILILDPQDVRMYANREMLGLLDWKHRTRVCSVVQTKADLVERGMPMSADFAQLTLNMPVQQVRKDQPASYVGVLNGLGLPRPSH